MNGHARVQAYVEARGLDARLIAPQAAMPTVPLAAAALGVAERQIVKTIVFEGKKGSGTVAVAIVTGDRRVDRSKVAAVLALPVLKLASPHTVSAVIGYEVGGVPPVAHAEEVPVVVDRRVLELGAVYGGGGDDFHMLEIAPQDIVRLTKAVIADVTMDAGPAPADP